MRTALVLYGQPRFAEICYNNFYKDLIQNMKADVFFHTYWSPEMVGSLYPCAPHARHALRDDDLMIQPNMEEKLLDLFKPINHICESYKDIGRNENYQYHSQWMSKCIVADALAHDVVDPYDMIIRSRFDMMCTQQIVIDEDELNCLWVPSCCPYTDIRVNDMFSISNWSIFCKITDAVIHMKEYHYDGHGEMEWPLARQIQRHMISVKTFQADYSTFDILRSDTAGKYR